MTSETFNYADPINIQTTFQSVWPPPRYSITSLALQWNS